MHHINEPIQSHDQADLALSLLDGWSAGENYDDRLIEIFVFRAARLWRDFPQAPEFRFTKPSIIRRCDPQLIDDLEWHRLRQASGPKGETRALGLGAFYLQATCVNLLGSLGNGERFRHAMQERFERPDGSPCYGDRAWHRPILRRNPELMFGHFLSPAHRQRREAFTLEQATQALTRSAPRPRL